MSLTKAQQAMLARARALGGGRQGVALSDNECIHLVATIVNDLQRNADFPDLPACMPPFFSDAPVDVLRFKHLNFPAIFEQLLDVVADADTYFLCLLRLYKARVKYERILCTQPIPTIDQLGPRGLVEFGKLDARHLTAYLKWRKWIFDIDNRAAQETGYIFEPIIASSIGGVSVSASKSPIRRHRDTARGRQVDCIKAHRAYEFKLRMTIAASGQGRWQEELEFPHDCRESGFTPILIVLDSTPNPRLVELCKAFSSEGGEAYVGEEAWSYLQGNSGATMAVFLERYILYPLREFLRNEEQHLPTLCIRMGIIYESGETPGFVADAFATFV